MPATQTKTRDLAAIGMTTRAVPMRPDTIDEDHRSVEAVLSTENPATVFDWAQYRLIDEVLIARGAELPERRPMLETHQRWSLDNVLGSVREMRVENQEDESRVVGRLFFTTGDTRVDRAWNKVSQGHVTDVSVGYRAVEYTDIKPNTTKRVGGRNYTARDRTLRITTKWKLREASLVPIGADEAANIREEYGGGGPKTEKRDMPSNEVIEQLTNQADADAQRATGHAAPPAQTPEPTNQVPDAGRTSQDANPNGTGHATPPVAPGVDAVRREAAAAERERIRQVTELAGSDVPGELVTRAINEGLGVDAASKLFLEAIRAARPEAVNRAPAIITHDGNPTRDVLAAGLMIRCGHDEIPPDASDSERRRREQFLERGDRYRNACLMDIVDLCVRADNGPHRLDVSDDEFMRAATTSMTLAYVFTQSIEASVMQGYSQRPDTTRLWTRDISAANFKQHTQFRLEEGGRLTRHPRGGTADDAHFSDTGETFRIDRFSQKVVVDDQDVIDDNFDALTGIPRKLGMAAARLRPDLAYSLLLANPDMSDSVALFHASHGNLNASSAFSFATLTAGRTAMYKQTENGVILQIDPRFILVPPELEVDALQLIRSVEVRDTTSDTRYGVYNPVQAMRLNVIPEARLSLGVTDPNTEVVYSGSATTWFLVGDGADGIAIAYLRGNNGRPTLRNYALSNGQFGRAWDIKLDIGAAALDFRGLQKNTA